MNAILNSKFKIYEGDTDDFLGEEFFLHKRGLAGNNGGCCEWGLQGRAGIHPNRIMCAKKKKITAETKNHEPWLYSY